MVIGKQKTVLIALSVLCLTTLGTTMSLRSTQAVEAQGRPATRHEFARALAKIKVGMPEKEILALLGKPDDIKTHNDGGGIARTGTKEIWRYGTNGHLTFPTLGCVYIDNERKAHYIYGGRGEPPDAKLFPEAHLCELLRLIDQAPSYNSAYQYDPLAVIRIVNALQPLGKDKALAAIAEYLRVSSDSPAREGMFLVLRVLFDVPADPGHMPHMFVGLPLLWPGAYKDPKRVPRLPVLMADDVPLMLASGYMLGGYPEQPESHVKYFHEKGQILNKPLAPGNAPLRLLSTWSKNAGYEKDPAPHVKLLIANQLLNLVDSVHRRDADASGYKFWPEEDVDGQWKAIEAQVEKLDIRWSAEKNRYTFKDGTSLPDPIRKLYRRHIWKLDGLNGEASLILERTDAKHVWACLNWSGKTTHKMPPFTLSLFAVTDKMKAFAEISEMSTMSISGSAGDEAFSSQSYVAELPDEAEIHARLTIGKREQVSPDYRPSTCRRRKT